MLLPELATLPWGFSDPKKESAETHLVDEQFVVISDVDPSKVSDWFSKP
jgi:hypothetical protein